MRAYIRRLWTVTKENAEEEPVETLVAVMMFTMLGSIVLFMAFGFIVLSLSMLHWVIYDVWLGAAPR